jgi:hypothetical protein
MGPLTTQWLAAIGLVALAPLLVMLVTAPIVFQWRSARRVVLVFLIRLHYEITLLLWWRINSRLVLLLLSNKNTKKQKQNSTLSYYENNNNHHY